MAMPGKRTRQIRANKKKRAGAVNKRARVSQGTTISFPLEGTLPSARYGRAIDAEKIKTN